MAVLVGGASMFCAITTASRAFAGSGSELDPTCSVVNRAYAATRSTETYSAKVFGVEDGRQTLNHEYRVTADMQFERYADGVERHGVRKAAPPLSYHSGPRFASCQLVKDKASAASANAHYTAKWASVPYTADAAVWLTDDGQKMKKVVLRYHSSYMRPSRFPEHLEIFSYESP
ncbi:hypothetical protein ACIQUG_27265 [Ensifer sp. NPDC090286]|uniref:hypothetical protein n=1 Tax=Ensifer sp. NPDC090286 TaxID=3363991 RepID=UPI003839DD61